MSFPQWMSLMRHASLVAAAVLWQLELQAHRPRFPIHTFEPCIHLVDIQLTELLLKPIGPDPDGVGRICSAGAPTPSASASSDGGGGGQYAAGERHGVLHNWAFEAGGGFNAPDEQLHHLWRAVHGGRRLEIQQVSVRVHRIPVYRFDKLPGYLIAETGANGGYAHIWSFTFDPVIDLMPKATNGVYITGGGGFYRKVTSFTDPEETEYCYYFCEVGTVQRGGAFLLQSGRDSISARASSTAWAACMATAI